MGTMNSPHIVVQDYLSVLLTPRLRNN